MSHVIQYSVDQTPFSFSFPRQRHWIKRKSWKQFMSLFLCYYFWQNLESLSSHVRESVLRNPGNFCSWRIRNPGIFCLESGIPLKETGIPLTIEIRIPSSTDTESGMPRREYLESTRPDCLGFPFKRGAIFETLCSCLQKDTLGLLSVLSRIA